MSIWTQRSNGSSRVPIRRLFWERGETAFRAIEHDALRTCLARSSTPTILALGGGASIQPNNVELLRASAVRTVFLETPVEEMLTRCGVDDEPDPENPRPLAADASAFRKLYDQRLPFYRAAHLTIDTSGKTVEEVAKQIAESSATHRNPMILILFGWHEALTSAASRDSK